MTSVSHSSFKEDDREFNYKKKYFFTIFMFTYDVRIYELSPIANAEDDGWEKFIEEKDFKRIWNFHKQTRNYCPFLSQSWICECVDVWESLTNCKVYNTKEECEKEAILFLLKVKKKVRSRDEYRVG